MLYLSRHIVRTKADYYRLLQAVRDADAWEDWVLYLLEAVEQTAGQTIRTIHGIKDALFAYKHRIRNEYKFYSQDLINNLFMHTLYQDRVHRTGSGGFPPDRQQISGCLAAAAGSCRKRRSGAATTTSIWR